MAHRLPLTAGLAGLRCSFAVRVAPVPVQRPAPPKWDCTGGDRLFPPPRRCRPSLYAAGLAAVTKAFSAAWTVCRAGQRARLTAAFGSRSIVRPRCSQWYVGSDRSRLSFLCPQLVWLRATRPLARFRSRVERGPSISRYRAPARGRSATRSRSSSPRSSRAGAAAPVLRIHIRSLQLASNRGAEHTQEGQVVLADLDGIGVRRVSAEAGRRIAQVGSARREGVDERVGNLCPNTRVELAERCQDLVHTLAGDQAVEVLDVRANLLGVMAPTASRDGNGL